MLPFYLTVIAFTFDILMGEWNSPTVRGRPISSHDLQFLGNHATSRKKCGWGTFQLVSGRAFSTSSRFCTIYL